MKILSNHFIGYHLEMLPDAQYAMRDYYFKTQKDVDEFLDSMNDGQIEKITSITKYTEHRCRDAWDEFFNYRW